MNGEHSSAPEALPEENDVDQQLRDKALHIAKIMCTQAFEGRADQVERHLSREQLQAYLALAFEYGAHWESMR